MEKKKVCAPFSVMIKNFTFEIEKASVVSYKKGRAVEANSFKLFLQRMAHKITTGVPQNFL